MYHNLMSKFIHKMLKGEIIDITSKNKYNVSFFEDDSIENVRMQIGRSLDVHPDRLFILVGLKLPVTHYSKDPRNWEDLFDRLSYNGEPITQEVFTDFQLNYRSPQTSIPFSAYDRTEWMSKPDSLIPLFEPTSEFIEYKILGTKNNFSYVLPLDSKSTLISKIPSVKLPIPETNTLFCNIYEPSQFMRFVVKVYDDTMETATQVYFPLLRSTTPPRLTEETIRLLGKNTTTLERLLKLDAPKEESTTIIRTRFYIPWIDTDFGSAIRTRFEQILDILHQKIK
jgi:hypothetical protein